MKNCRFARFFSRSLLLLLINSIFYLRLKDTLLFWYKRPAAHCSSVG